MLDEGGGAFSDGTMDPLGDAGWGFGAGFADYNGRSGADTQPVEKRPGQKPVVT